LILKSRFTLIFISAALLSCTHAFASPSVWLSGAAGPSLLSESGFHTGLHPSISPFLGFEAAYNIRDVLYMGGFYDLNLMSVEKGNSLQGADLHFLGFQTRVRLARPQDSSSFMDIKMGPAQLRTQGAASLWELGFGVAYSYEYPFSPGLSMGIRLGYRLIHYERSAGELSLGFLESTVLLRVGL